MRLLEEMVEALELRRWETRGQDRRFASEKLLSEARAELEFLKRLGVRGALPH